MTPTLSTKQALVGAAAIAGLVWLGTRDSGRTLQAGAFFDPDAVADIASRLPEGDDDFILAAWTIVGKLPYEPVGSVVTVLDSANLKCSRCYLTGETRRRALGNCVSKASMLASILLNRMSPERIYIAIGDLDYKGIVGGHAWLVVQRMGSWFVLEATAPPPDDAWRTVEQLQDKYRAYVLIAPDGVICESPGVCLKAGDVCPCLFSKPHEFWPA